MFSVVNPIHSAAGGGMSNKFSPGVDSRHHLDSHQTFQRRKMPLHPTIGNKNNMMTLLYGFRYKGENDKCAILTLKVQKKEKVA